MSLTTLRRFPQVSHFALLVLVVSLVGSAGCSKEFSVTAPDSGFTDTDNLVGSGVMGSATIPVSGFTGVKLSSVGTVQLVQGSAESLRIEAEDNLLEAFDAHVSSGMLVITTKPGMGFKSSLPITFYVSAREVQRISVSGVGKIEAAGLSAGRLAIEMSGPGLVRLSELSARHVAATLSGPGRIELSGSVESQNVLNSGPGEYDARSMHSAEAEVDLSGIGDATVRVSRELRVRVSGLGSVYYIGNPVVDGTVTGMGGVVPISG